MSSKNNDNLDAEARLKSIPKKAVKKTSRFTVLLIPDSTDHAKSFELTFDQIVKIFAVIIAIVLVLVSLLISSGLKIYRLSNDDTSTRKIEELNEQIEGLKEEKAEMYDQIVSLTGVIAEKQEAEKNQEEIEAAKSIPTGYPVEGYALIVQDPTVSEGEKVKGRVVFNAISGTVVVASAEGVVTDISIDPTFGTVITIDHENGYQSVYRSSGRARVEIGDRVAGNEVLFVLTEEDTLFAYELFLNGQAIEPLDIMDTKG